MAGLCSPEADAAGEQGPKMKLCSTAGNTKAVAVDAVGGEGQGAPAAYSVRKEEQSGSSSNQCQDKGKDKGGFAQEDLDFRATLPRWVLDLIDIAGLEISNRGSDFYEDETDDEEDESDEEEPEEDVQS